MPVHFNVCAISFEIPDHGIALIDLRFGTCTGLADLLWFMGFCVVALLVLGCGARCFVILPRGIEYDAGVFCNLRSWF